MILNNQVPLPKELLLNSALLYEDDSTESQNISEGNILESSKPDNSSEKPEEENSHIVNDMMLEDKVYLMSVELDAGKQENSVQLTKRETVEYFINRQKVTDKQKEHRINNKPQKENTSSGNLERNNLRHRKKSPVPFFSKVPLTKKKWIDPLNVNETDRQKNNNKKKYHHINLSYKKNNARKAEFNFHSLDKKTKNKNKLETNKLNSRKLQSSPFITNKSTDTKEANEKKQNKLSINKERFKYTYNSINYASKYSLLKSESESRFNIELSKNITKRNKLFNMNY